MGYILPVNHYQYQDYQIRTTQTDRSPFVLDRIYKASLDSKCRHGHQWQRQDLFDYQKLRGIYTSRHFHAAPASKKTKENVYSEVTGKGRNFSETV